MKKFIKIILLMIVVCFIFWVGSLLKCEYLTQKYYNDFENAYTANTMLGDMEFFKVLSCDGKYAEVYYVSKNHTAADILTFENNQQKWVYKNWETVWTTLGGNADGTVWPYWWHFIYGGF